MRSLFVIAMLLLTGIGARAETFSFVIGGRAIHIGIHGRCGDMPCVSVHVPGYRSREGRRSLRSQRQHDARRGKARPAAASQDIAMGQTPAPKAAMVPEAAPRSVAPAAEPAPVPAAEPKSATERAPIDTAAVLQPAKPKIAEPKLAEQKIAEQKLAEQKIAALPERPADPAPATKPEPPTVIAALPPADPEAEQAAKPALAIGTWSNSEGLLRIEPCGPNLCGYVSGGKHAGKTVLINMRQTKANSWAGRVQDLKRGGIYPARMTLRGPNTLRVDGCAFGGMICDGRTLARVN